MIHRPPPEHRVHCCLLPVPDCLQTLSVSLASWRLRTGEKENVNVGTLCDGWQRRAVSCLDVWIINYAIFNAGTSWDNRHRLNLTINSCKKYTRNCSSTLLKTCWCHKTCSILKGDRDKVGRLTRKRCFFFLQKQLHCGKQIMKR